MAAPQVDMSGKSVMITGFTAGVGKAAAFALADMGADLALVCRNADKGKATLESIRARSENPGLHMLVGDLGRQRDIRRIAAEFLSLDKPLHVLFNNAGVIMQRRSVTEDGYETTFAVNHLGYFLLTHLLLDCLRASAPARVVCTASDAHKFAGKQLDFDDLQSERSYTTFGAYGRSKLGNILFTQELARREAEKDSGVTANAFHPGFVGSEFSKNNGSLARVITTLISPFARSIEKGAETGIYLCTSPGLESTSGGYFYDMKPLEPSANAKVPENARRLWQVSEQLTGL